MARFGLIGDAYSSQSSNADYQKTLNLYMEHDESGAGKSDYQLYPTPGLSLFSVCGTGPIRAELNANERCFSVSGDSLYEVFSDGTNSLIGAVGNDGQPVSLCNSATQLLIISAGTAYVYDLDSNAFMGAVNTGLGAVKMGQYSDGFFIALISDSQKFQISSPLDATLWDPTDVTQVTVFPDKILSMIVDHREIILHGVTKSVVYGNTGAADFPYSPIASSYIEQGIAAAWARDRLDNSEFWLGADDRGHLIANRLSGYTPSRISNFAIENEWQSYSGTSDTISYAYQDRGHTFWQLYFPTADKTWTYDVATNAWHQRSFLNPVSGLDEAHLSRCHTFVFGQHLVGDRRNGNIYVMSIAIPDDDGYPIKSQRRSPHISNEQQWIYHSQLQLDAECGEPTIAPLLIGLGTGSASLGLVGASSGASAVPPDTNIVLGDLGPLDIVLEGIYVDGSRKVSPVFVNVTNSSDHVPFVNTPVLANVDHWNVYYCATGDDTVPSYTLTYTYAEIAAFGNRINFPFTTLGAPGPSLDSRLTSSPLGGLGNLDLILMAIFPDGSREVSLIQTNVTNTTTSIPYVVCPPVVNNIGWRVYYCPTGADDVPSYFVNFTKASIAPFGQINLPPDLGNVAPSLNYLLTPRNPIVWMNFSDDGGHTWSNQIEMNLGLPGQYAYRCITRRLGRSRDRIYNFEYSDTARLRIIDCYLEASPGYPVPSGRIVDTARKQA